MEFRTTLAFDVPGFGKMEFPLVIEFDGETIQFGSEHYLEAYFATTKFENVEREPIKAFYKTVKAQVTSTTDNVQFTVTLQRLTSYEVYEFLADVINSSKYDYISVASEKLMQAFADMLDSDKAFIIKQMVKQ